MFEAAGNAAEDCFGAAGGFPVKLKKIPCSEGIWAGVSDFAAIRCISGAVSRKINGLVLIFFILARARARGQQRTATDGRREGGEEADGKAVWRRLRRRSLPADASAL
jgi:hypothetical protein